MKGLRAALLSSALLLGLTSPGGSLAGTPSPVPETVTTAFGRLPVRDSRDVQVALRAPGFAGVWVNDPGIVIAVTTTDPEKRAAIVRALREVWGGDLELQGENRLDTARFVMVKYDALQLAQVRQVAWGVKGWWSIGVDVKANRVKVELRLPEQKAPAEAYFRARGIPLDAVNLNAPASPLLPPKTTLTHPLKAWLGTPGRVAQNDILPLVMNVQNLGKEDLKLNIVCAFEYRVVSVDTGKVVRPVPAPGVCPSLGAWVTIPPGQTRNALVSPWSSATALPFYWDLKDPQGQPVPPGKYVLQLAHGNGNGAIRPADLTFTVLPPAKDGGLRAVLEALSRNAGPQEPERETVYMVREGVPRLQVTVPDERARLGVVALAKARKVSLARVDFVVLPTPPVPPAGSSAQATLKAWPQPLGFRNEHSLQLSLALDVLRRVTPGAAACETVFVIRRVSTGGLVFAKSQGVRVPAAQRSDPKACLPGWSLTQHAQWRGQLTDGTPAPAGEYEVRAGLRVTGRDGRVRWVAAPPKKITAK